MDQVFRVSHQRIRGKSVSTWLGQAPAQVYRKSLRYAKPVCASSIRITGLASACRLFRLDIRARNSPSSAKSVARLMARWTVGFFRFTSGELCGLKIRIAFGDAVVDIKIIRASTVTVIRAAFYAGIQIGIAFGPCTIGVKTISDTRL